MFRQSYESGVGFISMKKASKFQDCMKGFSTDYWLNTIAPKDVIELDEEQIMRTIDPSIVSSYNIMKRQVFGLVNRDARIERARQIFIELVRKNPDVLEFHCAVQHADESGITQYTWNDVEAQWEALRQAAKNKEYDEVFGRLNELITQTTIRQRQIYERGKVAEQAVAKKVGTTTISPTVPTFKYTPSGVPLFVLGEVGFCCGLGCGLGCGDNKMCPCKGRFPNEG